MTDEIAETIETAPEADTQTLEDISSEFSVEEQVSNFQASPEQPAQAEQPQQNWTPDPISDPDAYSQYANQQASTLNTLSQSITTLSEKLTAQEQQLAQQKIDADVGSAVAKVNEKLGLDPKMTEIALEHEYRDNPAFKKIWDNRAQNPKAFDKALGVVSDKFSSVFSVSQDHQLTQNQLAAKQSLKTMGKTAQTDKNSEWEGLSSADFDQKWNEMRRG